MRNVTRRNRLIVDGLRSDRRHYRPPVGARSDHGWRRSLSA